MTNRRRARLAHIATPTLRHIADGQKILEVGLVRTDAEVISYYPRKGSLKAFSIMARENVAIAMRRSIRFAGLGKPMSTMMKHTKLTLVTLMVDEKHYLYGVSKSTSGAKMIKKLESVSSSIRKSVG
jgi:hypothetical protein